MLSTRADDNKGQNGLNKAVIENVVYPLMERFRGNTVRDKLAALRESQYADFTRIQENQREKLKNLLLHSIQNVPAYHDFLPMKARIQADPISALKAFPILDKRKYNIDPLSYLSQTAQPETLIKNHTGGSTGQPTVFYMDRETVEGYEAARWRGLSWWGITPGSRSVMIWGNPFELSKLKQRSFALKERFLKNRIILSAYTLNPEEISQIASRIEAFRPEYIYGYASALHTVAGLIKKADIHLSLSLKAVVSTAETLHEHQREQIQSAFGCPVVNEYGARDAGILAYACPGGSMHISAENTFIEIVDPVTGEPLPAGACGSVLTTDLNNYSAVRLRYKVGDMAALSEKSCGCAINLPVLAQIEGREDSMFITTQGSFVHANAFNQIARELSSISQFQIIQKSPDRAVLKIAYTDNPENRERDTKVFLAKARSLLPGTEITIFGVDAILPETSGKYRYSIREF